jgi:hypothetical protein
VVARFAFGAAHAAVLEVPAHRLALYVVELPLAAACGAVTAAGGGATDRIGPQPRLCARALR